LSGKPTIHHVVVRLYREREITISWISPGASGLSLLIKALDSCFVAMLLLSMESSRFVFSVFKFDAAAGVLKRNDQYLRVPPQTLLLLTALLEHAGAVVTREYLRQLLWPDVEFIDHDHAINRAVNFLRTVLRDNPKKPQFIETLPKRGYRFIGEVSCLPSEAQPSTGFSLSSLQPQATPGVGSEIRKPETIEWAQDRFGEVLTPLSGDFEASESVSPHSDLMFLEETYASPRHNSPFTRLAVSVRRAPSVYFLSLGIVAVLAFALILSRHNNPSSSGGLTIGIIPFETQGAQAGQIEQSFRMDISETLSQLPALQVRASHSLGNLKKDDASLKAIAKSLNLDLLLLGRLTIEDNRCVLRLELVRGRDATHLASFQYTGSLQEMAAIRDKTQRDIYSGLQLTGGSAPPIAGSTQNQEAYIDYLQAKGLASVGTAAAQNDAVVHFKNAIVLDPMFARAYAGMASAYLGMAGAANRADILDQAKEMAEKAERINPLVAEAHTVLGVIAIRDEWNAARGEAELRRAVELEPNNAANHGWLAELLADEGHPEEALREVDVARASDPMWAYINAVDTFVSGAAHQYDREVDAARRNVAMAPNSSRAHDQLAWSLFDAGRYEESIGEWRATAVIDKDKARVALEDRGLAEYRRGGAPAYAAVRISAIEQHPEATTFHPHDFIPEEWYAFVGDRDHAIAALQQTIDRHDPSALDLAVNPMLDNLHRDPRFLSLLSRVGLSLPSSDTPATVTRASLTD
jgi:DNA-binding winged helix-turn-helix (wHTH) protein/tetratricopeptide (TPR) repeat protein